MEEFIQQLTAAIMTASSRAATEAGPRRSVLDTKILTKPRTFSGVETAWSDWKFAMKTYLVVLDNEYEDELEQVEGKTEEVIENLSMTDTVSRSRTLFAILVSCTEGKALRIVRGVQNRSGYEGWRRLTVEYQPNTRSRSLAMMQSILRPQFTGSELSFLEELQCWEMQVEQHEQITGKQLDDQVKTAVILQAIPNSIRALVQFQVEESTRYTEVREKVANYLRTQRAWSVASNSMGSAPMEIDMIQQHGKGGKGKGKGKGKSASQGQQWHAAQGHQQWQQGQGHHQGQGHGQQGHHQQQHPMYHYKGIKTLNKMARHTVRR